MPEPAELEKLITDCMSKKNWTREHCERYVKGGIWGLQTYNIEEVPILKTGKWVDANGRKVPLEINDLNEIIRNTNALLKTHLLEPRLKLGHNETQPFKVDGLPAFGHISRVYRIGDEAFADFIDLPKQINDLIQTRAYTDVSAELYENFEHPTTKEKIGMTLKAVALLGADMPAIKGLGNITGLYHSEVPQMILTFSEEQLKEVNEMTKVWTLEDIGNFIKCKPCVEKIKVFMEEKKKESLTTQELADWLSEFRVQEIIKVQEGDEVIECPTGYKWDTEKQKCVAIDDKVQAQEQNICPKGYIWNEEQQKCVEIEVKEGQEGNTCPEGQEWNEELQKCVEIKKTQEGQKTIKVDADIKEKIGDEIDENDMINQSKKAETKLSDKKFALPGGDPVGWTKESYATAFDALGGTYTSCLENVSGVTDPERFCAWMKYKATGEWPGTEEWRAKETNKSIQVNKDNQELMEKVKQLEKEKREKALAELKEKNRGILLPKFDEYFTIFSEQLERVEGAIKFGEQKFNLAELFLKFLNELVASKAVIMQEILKSTQSKETLPIQLSVTEEQVNKFAEQYKEDRPAEKIDRTDLALFAEKVAKEQNIPYRDALLVANKIMEKGK